MNLGIGYESSDEENTAPIEQPQKLPVAANDIPQPSAPAPKQSPSAPSKPESPQQPEPSSAADQGSLTGPALGPTAAASPPSTSEQQEASFPPNSPYTHKRTLIRTLTLPTAPNFSIPPSPPGSPPQRSTKKFIQFLDLKKRGTHFNQRLEKSSVLKDPGHLHRLMKFSGLSEEDQYSTTLPDGVAVPVKWQKEAYFEELRGSQKEMLRKKEAERKAKGREGIEFVPAAGRSEAEAGRSDGTIRAGTPGGADRQALGKRKELEHRGRRDDERERKRSHERSPKRRRDGSRERR